jgi:hypothetical protein
METLTPRQSKKVNAFPFRKYTADKWIGIESDGLPVSGQGFAPLRGDAGTRH